MISIDSVSSVSDFENISIVKLNADSNATSMLVWIKKEIKPHLHASHSEHVYVLQGTGKMLLDNRVIDIKEGDLVFIPQNSVHAVRVTSELPMKVLSIQAPEFDGNDRVPVPVDVTW
ncbi:MAG: cupin domain-containing protein [Chitinophagales bacterium]|nr:cupin domain-containing protein [Chitinophagales bacterium]